MAGYTSKCEKKSKSLHLMPDPYGDLRRIIINFYKLSSAQRTDNLPDQRGLGAAKPSVLWDSVEDIMFALFFRRMPACISHVVGTRKFENHGKLTALCNQVWEHRGGAVAAMAATHRPAAARPRRRRRGVRSAVRRPPCPPAPTRTARAKAKSNS